MRAFWSSLKNPPLRKIAYEATFLRTLQPASTKLGHVTTRATTNRKSVNWHQTHWGKTITDIDTSSRGQLTIVPVDEPGKMTVVYNAGKAVSKGRAPTTLCSKSVPSIDSALWCRFCLEQKHRTIEWNMITEGLLQKLIKARNEIWRQFWQYRSGFISHTRRIITIDHRVELCWNQRRRS